MNHHLRTISRCTGLVIVAIAALALVPATAQAQNTLHGVQILKGCGAAVSNCNSDSDCDDTLICNGTETCSTPSANEPTNHCTIRVTNVDEDLDSVRLQSFVDVWDTTNTNVSYFLDIATVQDNPPLNADPGLDTTCTVGFNLGTLADLTQCTLAPGDFVTFFNNQVTFSSLDVGTFIDQATIQFLDNCDGVDPAGSGCDPATVNTNQASGSTTVNNNCQPGTPLVCPAPAPCHLQGVCEEPNGCTDPNAPDSSAACAPDTDPTDCTTPGCAAGVCVQTHTPVAESTACGTDTDGLTCTTPGCTPTGICNQTHISNCEGVSGRMTGGGSVFTSDGQRVTHGFELHCDLGIGPNNLEINWGPGNNFHLDALTSVTCSDDPAIEPPPPGADFDTYSATGTGSCNGVPGATITFTLTDAGEPGGGKNAPNDTATFQITCADGLTLSVSSDLKKGNQQAHPENK